MQLIDGNALAESILEKLTAEAGEFPGKKTAGCLGIETEGKRLALADRSRITGGSTAMRMHHTLRAFKAAQ